MLAPPPVYAGGLLAPMGRMAYGERQMHRMAEALGSLTLAVDVANRFPPEKVLRTVLLTGRIARAAGVTGEALRRSWWLPLLRYLGCTAFGFEEAHRYGAGDDRALRNTMVLADEGDPVGTLRRIAGGFAPDASVAARWVGIGRILGDGRSFVEHAAAQCEGSAWLARAAGFPEDEVALLADICERWDGKGQPQGLRGPAQALPARLYRLADVAEVGWHRGGVSEAVALVRQRSGGQLDPDLCARFLEDPAGHLRDFDGSVWERFLDDEPEPRLRVGEDRVDAVCRAFANVVDVRSTFTLGHSTGVARLAERAAVFLGVSPEERTALRRAALLHDVGRLAVPLAVWDRTGPLGPADREAVRAHAYHTERILDATPAFRSLATLAAAGHERLDGRGYHRAIPRGMLELPARLLAAADVRQALREPRPHRPARSDDDAVRLLGEEVAAGRLDAEAVRAVLMAAGDPDDLPSANPAGLSDREVEVLVLLARGSTNKEIAAALSLSPKTVQHHVAHVYDKVGVRSRAAASLFATDHGLVGRSGRRG